MGWMVDVVRSRPGFTPTEASQIAHELYGIRSQATELPSDRDQNFKLQDGAGTAYILKIANGQEERANLDFENGMMRHLAEKAGGIVCPRVVGEGVTEYGGYWVRLITFLPGRTAITTTPHTSELLRDIGYKMGRLDSLLQDFTHPAMHRELHWDMKQGLAVTGRVIGFIADPDQRALAERARQQFAEQVSPHLAELRQSVIHNDGNTHNLLVENQRVSGIIDFGDAVYTCTVFEVAVAATYAMLDKPAPLAVAAQVVAGYQAAYPLTELELDLLPSLMGMRLCTSVCLSAWQKTLEPDNAYLTVSEAPAWAALATWLAIPLELAQSIFHLAARGAETRHTTHYAPRTTPNILALRRKHLAANLSVSYDEPLKMVRGRGQWLYDESGRAFLDCVNNVCHVGHSHPQVVAAGQRQMAILNTNTRYLHDNLVEYARRLADLLPDPLEVCFFVCSGSEANELAIRLARAHTGRDDLIVLDGAYHGNTNLLIDLSPYKHDGPGGRGTPAYVHKAVMPDPYRGVYKGYQTGKRYARHIRAILAANPERVAGFLCESVLGCGGQVVLPDDYLKLAFGQVREAGGVCIADEVQVGFGRVGSHFWGFETQGVVPDIVTMGKPMGNGHPLAAVVTTRAIADSFANGMEYFNTFGGNPVSCAMGLAVLDVIEQEGLQANAEAVGAYLLAGFRGLMAKHALIGDVRGVGLFVGVELVRDRVGLVPAGEEARFIANQMRQRGILISTDGPFHNVLKLKPPLVFSQADADLVITHLDEVLASL